MKKYFSVTFKYSDTVYCTNIAHAETVEDVKKRYSKYEWTNIPNAKNMMLSLRRERG